MDTEGRRLRPYLQLAQGYFGGVELVAGGAELLAAGAGLAAGGLAPCLVSRFS
jgi:hypothetical protein